MYLCVLKAQDLGNKERYLREWEDELRVKERKLDMTEDTVFSLRREVALKESIIVEKTAWAVKLERDCESAVRTSIENERAYEEVFGCILYVFNFC